VKIKQEVPLSNSTFSWDCMCWPAQPKKE